MRFRSAAAVFVAAMALSACAADESLTDVIAGPGRVRGGRDAVMVFRADSVADALPLAVAHCAHFRRSAQFQGRLGDAFRFRCTAG